MATVFTKRIVAYILDFFVVSSIMWIISYFLSLMVKPADAYQVFQFLPYVVPILILIYFVFCEKVMSATVGKSLMRIKVQSENGLDITWLQAIVRNLTKIYWFPIIFDWLIGRFLNSDRLFDVITKTVVVRERF